MYVLGDLPTHVSCSLSSGNIPGCRFLFASSCCVCRSGGISLMRAMWACGAADALWHQRFKLLFLAVLGAFPHLASSRHLDEYQYLLSSCILGKAVSGAKLDLENCSHADSMKTALELLPSDKRGHYCSEQAQIQPWSAALHATSILLWVNTWIWPCKGLFLYSTLNLE